MRVRPYGSTEHLTLVVVGRERGVTNSLLRHAPGPIAVVGTSCAEPAAGPWSLPKS
ncbi:hypothetical protein [Nonomuraea maheshkhaliensis]|uniref:hypothetical protein n=1 Tax=Nonomuraea maheshkhaliensis TaxID=419590 RepID=UPI0031F7AE6A